MLNIINNSSDPYFNLALEEYALKNIKGDLVIFWKNEKTVVIGRNQNIYEEINYKYIKENKINIVRRLSGGGAVYHDGGNLNFTFITEGARENINNFKKFTEPVINALQSIGVDAEFSGRNDIVVAEKKISGNAQYYYENRLLHHGTLLFDTDLDTISMALNVNMGKLESKGIKSVRSRVANISSYLKKYISIDEFKDILISKILTEGSQNYKLTKEEFLEVKKLADKKYKNWEWNFGKAPEFKISKKKRYEGGELDIKINVSQGIISGIKIYGDFLGYRGTEELEKLLTGKKFEENDISDILKKINIKKIFGEINEANIVDCIFY